MYVSFRNRLNGRFPGRTRDHFFFLHLLASSANFRSTFLSLNQPLLRRELHLHLMQLESRRVKLLFLRAVSPVETPLLLGHGDEDEDADEGEEEHPAEDRAHDVDQVGRDGGVVEGGRRRGEGVLKRRAGTV